jgi:amino acid transporter
LTEPNTDINHDDRAVIDAGYQPQLRRSLGFFSSFAIPFSEISITTGIFANFGFVLGKAGPFGFWTWPVAALGHLLLALVFAEMAGRIPLTGSCYNWNNKLANLTIGWFAGWLGIVAYSIGVAAVSTTMIPILSAILGYQIDARIGCYLAAALVVLQMLINLASVRLTSRVNAVAVMAEIIGVVGLSILVTAAIWLGKGHFHPDLLTTIPAEPRPYWPGFLMCSLLGAWTMVGFETAADVSEETINARMVTPKGMIYAVLASAIIGFAFIVTMTLAIPDLAEVAKADYPLAAISSYYLGEGTTKIFLGFALVAMFACSMVVMTAGSRILFAVARDKRFILPAVFNKVSSHHVPQNAVLLVTGIAIIFTFMADNATSLYGAGTVCYALVYLMTAVGFAVKAPKFPATDTFSLGRWHWPVVVLTITWFIVEIGILTIPEEFHSVAIATGGILAVGTVLYFFIGRTR